MNAEIDTVIEATQQTEEEVKKFRGSLKYVLLNGCSSSFDVVVVDIVTVVLSIEFPAMSILVV